MQKRLMWVEYGETERLCNSHKGGEYSPLTRDLDDKLHHVVLRDVRPDEDLSDAGDPPPYVPDASASEEGDNTAALAGIVLLVLAGIAAKPHVERWWNDKASPAIASAKRSAQERIKRARNRNSAPPTTTEVAVVEPVTKESAGQRMTEDEARRRLMAALAARAFSDEQIRILQEVEISEDDYLALKASMEHMSTDEIAAQVHLALEMRSNLYDEVVLLLAVQQLAAPAVMPLPPVAAQPLQSG